MGYINKIKENDQLPSHFHYGNKSADNISDIVDVFADIFNSVNKNCTLKYMINLQINNDTNDLKYTDELEIGIDILMSSIAHLNNRSPVGPDMVDPTFDINCRNNLSYPLLYLYNMTLNKHVFHNSWKNCHLLVIRKTGNRTDINNY